MAGLRYYACVAAFFRCAGTLAQAASGAIRETQAVFEDGECAEIGNVNMGCGIDSGA